VVDSAQPAAAEAPTEAAPVEVAAADAAPAAAVDKDDLMKAGAKVYAANCQVCHQANGTGLPPSFPSLVGSKVATGPIDAHITQVLKGKNAMPPFPQLSDADVAAVVTYERNAFGNKVGDAAQAGQVAKLR
jgi:cytochrome c oxidase subunit II